MWIKLKRLLATYIDFAFIMIITTLFINIITLGNAKLSSNVIINCVIIFIYLGIVYFLLITKDLLFKNASLGKKILGIEIFNENYEKINDKKIIINRNKASMQDFPIYVFQILISNKSAGDKEYNTIVVNGKVKLHK